MEKEQAKQLERQFARVGARIRVANRARIGRRSAADEGRTFDLDVRRERAGETYVLAVTPDAPTFRVLQANEAARHLLLHAAGEDGGQRFLCGHDERHWFVAAVGERVTTVSEARRSLLPRRLRDAGITADELATRRNARFTRQGEWFFVPATDRQQAKLAGRPILHGEPLQRGARSKPHVVSELIRFGGQHVVLYEGAEYSMEQWDAKIRDPKFRAAGRVERRVKDPEVYVRGRVRHADHATIDLGETWHRVLLNGELVSRDVSFYD